MRPTAGRRLRAGRAAAVALLLLAVALPAAAARVSDVRIGKHPGFTRIVFELDRPAGYRVERSELAPGVAQLVVSLDADARSERVDVPKQALIEAVDIEAHGGRAVARIRLGRSGLRLKEMTLAHPARIVLDVLASEPEATAAAPTPAPRAAVREPAREAPAPAPVVIAPPIGEPVAEAVAEAVEVVEVATPRASPASPAPGAGIGDQGAGQAIDLAAQSANAASGVDVSEPTAPSPAGSEAVVEAPVAIVHEEVRVAMATREVPAASGPRTQLPPAHTGSASQARGPDGVFTLRNGAIALAGVLLLAAGAFVVARRRTGAVDDFDDEGAEALSDDNPFAGIEGPVTDAGASSPDEAAGPESASAADGQDDLFSAAAPATDAAAEPEIVAPGAAEGGAGNEAIESKSQEGPDMSVDGTMDFSAAPDVAAAGIAGAGAAAGFDADAVMQLVNDLQARVEGLETRLEEAVDARERLERQVAAQTEELRVQRAAIARTQRAVRNMSAPVEDTPTEPALREPRPEDR